MIEANHIEKAFLLHDDSKYHLDSKIYLKKSNILGNKEKLKEV